MLQRVFAIAASAVGSEHVVIATDDRRITDFASQIGARAVMTDPALRNGTERAAATLDMLDEPVDFVLNLQGDAVLTPPWVLSALVDAAAVNPTYEMVTPATRMSPDAFARLKEAKARGEVGGTTVVFGRTGQALYFSKSLIPYVRTGSPELPVFRHIGLYGYRPDTLRRLIALEAGPLETAEQLEQLRALEHGIPIQVVVVDYKGRTHWGVDTQADLLRCEDIIQAEGELLADYGPSVQRNPAC